MAPEWINIRALTVDTDLDRYPSAVDNDPLSDAMASAHPTSSAAFRVDWETGNSAPVSMMSAQAGRSTSGAV